METSSWYFSQDTATYNSPQCKSEELSSATRNVSIFSQDLDGAYERARQCIDNTTDWYRGARYSMASSPYHSPGYEDSSAWFEDRSVGRAQGERSSTVFDLLHESRPQNGIENAECSRLTVDRLELTSEWSASQCEDDRYMLSAPEHETACRGRARFTEEEDRIIVNLRKKGQPWKKIAQRLPGRSAGALQVRYSTKLKTKSTCSKADVAHSETKIREALSRYEEDKWAFVAAYINGGTGAGPCWRCASSGNRIDIPIQEDASVA